MYVETGLTLQSPPNKSIVENGWIYRVYKFLTHYRTTNFRLFQTERVCRLFQIWQKWHKVILSGRKHCGKRRNCFQKACFPGASKGVIVWEWVNQPNYYDNYPGKKQHFTIIAGKEDGGKQFDIFRKYTKLTFEKSEGHLTLICTEIFDSVNQWSDLEFCAVWSWSMYRVCIDTTMAWVSWHDHR